MIQSSSRVISQQNLLFCSTGPNASGFMLSSGGLSGINEVLQLQRVQNSNYGINVNRVPIFQFGQLAELDRVIINSPTVTLSAEWIVADAYNANTLGFRTDGAASMISGILNKTSDEKNYFILTAPQGVDADGYTYQPGDNTYVAAIGNGYLTDFRARGSVGQFATESISVEGLNFVTYSGAISGLSPAIIPQSGIRVAYPNEFILPVGNSGQSGAIPAIRPGNINLSFTTPFGPDPLDLKIQSYDLSVPISRQPINKLGSYFPISREIQFPITVTLSVEAEAGDLVSGSFDQLLCNDSAQNIAINLALPACGGNGPNQVIYEVIGAKLENVQYSTAIGQNQRVTLSFFSSLGGANDQSHNVIYSGNLI